MTAMNSASPTALITGASRGLGRALALDLARRGWQLILDGRDPIALDALRAALAQLTTVKAIAIAGDVTDPQHRAALIDAAETVGGLDALINNASTLGATPRPELLAYPLSDLADVFQTNVIAPLGLIQKARHVLKPGARLLNITSDAGVEPYAGWGGYGASKAALEHLSAILAAENPTWRVYWVDPGDMRTQLHQDAFPGEDITDRPLPEDSVPGLIRLLTEELPSGRYRAKHINPPNGVSGLRVVLTVADFEQAVALYRDGFRLPVRDLWLEPDSKGMLLDAGQATLELVNEAQAAEVDQIEVGTRSAGQIRLAFTVEDLSTAAKTMQQPGITSLGEPVLTPWQHLNQRFEAPEIQPGVQLTLSQVMDDTAEGGA